MYSMTKPDYGKGKFQGNVSLSINYLLFGGGGGGVLKVWHSMTKGIKKIKFIIMYFMDGPEKKILIIHNMNTTFNDNSSYYIIYLPYQPWIPQQ